MAIKQPQPPPSAASLSSSRSGHQSLSSSSRTGSSGKARSTPAVESAVTRLLVSIKQLLESLTNWSNSKASEEEVSDVYVRLGNDFNAAVAAFAYYDIDMSELLSVPDDLRAVLEDCLSDDASTATLDKYLPNVRSIITKLLQGLREKQFEFRNNTKRGSDASGHSRTDSQLSRSSRASSRRETKTSISSVEGGSSRKNTQSTGSRRKESGSYGSVPDGDEPFIGGFALGLTQQTPSSAQLQSASDRSSQTPTDHRQSSGLPNGSVPPSTPPQQTPQLPGNEPDPEATPIVQPRTSQVPANMKRYSLVDKPMQPPSVVIDEPSPQSPVEPDRGNSLSPPPELPAVDSLNSNPGVASSLAALKKSDALERRASKRFSTYNISKMTSTPRDRSGVGSGHPNRRSLVAGGGGALTAGELAVLTEADEDEEPAPAPPKPSPRRQRSTSRTRVPSPLAEVPEERPPVPPLPPPPPAPSQPPPPRPPEQAPVQTSVAESTINVPGGPVPITVFLQVGREVKKAKMEPGLTFSSLRMLFVDKFAYNPGQENFPAIYIRDPASGVQYELEDTDEVKDKCLLSLNIEPLDQIKQHIDTQISGLTQEMRDLRKAVAENRRSSATIPPPVVEDMTMLAPPPTDRQLQSVARRLSRLVQRGEVQPSSALAGQATPLVQQATGQSLLQPQMTGSSVMSEYSNRIVSDLRTQFDEVQNLRRDLGIMRQLYTEFMKQTKETLGGLRTQTQTVRQMASTQVPGARAYIDTGKQKLDARSQNLLTKMEELQDTVENVKDDVLKRHVTPKPQVLRSIKEGLSTVEAELTSLKDHIKTIKPMWKKTWEEELQSIVEEQQFLNHQEEFLADLIEDNRAVAEIYGHVEKVISIRGASGARGARGGRGFRPPPPDEGHTGLSTVMLEIRGATVDPARRLKAIEASQRSRERELAERSDEFEAELKGFVGGKKLKMTGGTEEAERVRQTKNDMSLKAMFTGGSATGTPPPASAPVSAGGLLAES